MALTKGTQQSVSVIVPDGRTAAKQVGDRTRWQDSSEAGWWWYNMTGQQRSKLVVVQDDRTPAKRDGECTSMQPGLASWQPQVGGGTR